jgi:hypothetical protein
MMLGAAEVLSILKEYGLAGVMAWLFWWTLRRMMASHDATVCQLKDQLDAQSQTTRAAGENFSKVVENHMAHVCDALGRFDAALSHHTTDQKRWQDRLLETLDRISKCLAAERRQA